eukprot:TRINITY_DN22340_c0_g1_i1.p1 TRINITY_DN22340_c0_g1~~TRINITY_DN22340_c0_g1_i1.p1  ORF type:complete len:111 (+),score=3.13 TRINITY_DN22340_c0_g1_i1:93-425(+)
MGFLPSNLSIYFFSLVLLATLLTTPPSSNVAAWSNNGDTPCNGSVVECQVEEEFSMESEVTTRFLLQQRPFNPLISRPACNKPRGESCLPRRRLTASTRQCNKYYQCRSR